MPNANLVAARNQLRTLVSIYNSNFDQYQQATSLYPSAEHGSLLAGGICFLQEQ